MPVTEGVITLLILALASALQAGTGFGFALMAIPVLSMSVNPVDAIAIVALAGGVMTAHASYRDRKYVDAAVTMRFCIGSLVGLPIGLGLLLLMTETAITAMIGLVVLVSVGAIHFGAHLPNNAPAHWTAGALSGAMMTSTGINGPPLVLTLHAMQLAQRPFRAALSVAFTFQRVMTLILFVLTDALSAHAVWLSLLGIPAILLGWELGNRVFHRLDATRFKRVVEVLLVLSAVFCLIRALSPLSG
jgi:uncharacterized membrane protein YfcA